MSLSPQERIRALLESRGVLAQRRSVARLRAKTAPASFGQRALWLAHDSRPSSAYNILAGFESESIDVEILAEAIRAAGARHEILRTSLRRIDDHLTQFIDDRAVLEPTIRDFSAMNVTDAQVHLESLISTEARHVFDLAVAPLVRVQIARLPKNRVAAIINLHHCVSDGWSQDLLSAEIIATYNKLRANDSSPTPALKYQYADYSVWQSTLLAGEQGSRQIEYWREQLNAAPPLHGLPLDRPRTGPDSARGARISAPLGAEREALLATFARAHKTTPFNVLLTLFGASLAHCARTDEIVIGIASANRSRAETRALVGYLVNSLPVRLTFAAQVPLVPLVANTQRVVLDALSHGDLPLEHILEKLGIQRESFAHPLFQLFFSYRESMLAELRFDGASIQPLRWDEHAARAPKFELALAVEKTAQGHLLSWEWNTAIFDEATVRYFITTFEHFTSEWLARATESVATHVAPLMRDRTRRQLLEEFNATRVSTPRAQLIHRLFERQVAKTPDASAVEHNGARITYGELNGRANRLAQHLRNRGVAADSLVAICLPRSLEMMVALVAILKAGGAYVPLDPAYPAERLQHMLDDSAPMILLTNRDLKSTLPQTSADVVDLDAIAFELERLATEDSDVSEVEPLDSSLVYVIYTSGSTGRPKGTALSHRSLLNLIEWQSVGLPVAPGLRVLQFAALSFDVAFQETFSTLCGGGTLVLLDEWQRRDPAALLDFVRDQSIERTFLPPLVLQGLAECHHDGGAPPLHLRDVVTAGERLHISKDIVALFRRLKDCRLHNHYGPTETHVVTSLTLDSHADSWPELPTIGRPIWNTRIYILDTDGNPVPVGRTGEIFIAGTPLARGYWKREDLTAERFVADPHCDGPDARMYKTGDLGRWRGDGTIEYLGRNDQQVKIRGFRIELGEIESQLKRHAQVRDVAVVAHDMPGGHKRLTAYFTAGADHPPTAEELLTHARGELPDYMIPSAFVRLDSLPLTPNGKLDRTALPIPDAAAFNAQPHEAPQGPIEERIAAIWQDLLHIDAIGRHDNFFELGGHSLIGLRITARIRQTFGIEVGLQKLFAAKSIAELAKLIPNGVRRRTTALLPRDRTGPIPLSFAQQRLWFIDRLNEAGSAYYLSAGARLRGQLDSDTLQKALDALVERHEILRTTIQCVGDVPLQQIDVRARFELQRIDLAHLARSEIDAQVARHAEEEKSAPLVIGNGPLIRGRLLRVSAEEHILLITLHHIVADGWSMSIAIREMASLYAAFVQGRDNPLNALPIQYADYALWQREWLQGDVLQREIDYWKERLAGAPPLIELPTDRPRPPVQSYRGNSITFDFESSLAERIHAFARLHDATPFMVLYAGFALLLNRLTAQTDIVIGASANNRQDEELENLIGFFVNNIPLRLQLQSDWTVRELLQQAKATTLDGFAHQEVPFEQIVEALRPPRSLSHSPVFQVLISLQNPEILEIELPSLELTATQSPQTAAQFDLVLSLTATSRGISGNFNFATALFDQRTIERWINHYQSLLTAMTVDPEARLDRLPLLTVAEHRLLVARYNDTHAPYSTDRLVHEILEAHASETPDSVAIVCQGLELTYGQLNRRANQLAHCLRQRGIVPESPVGLCTSRGIAMVVGVFGILKAGGAYIPLDPTLPTDSLNYIIQDAAFGIIVTEDVCVELLPAGTAQIVTLDAESKLLAQQPVSNLKTKEIGLTANHLAYLIYTSGSTGRPKGVMIEHRGLLNYLYWANTAYANPDAPRSVVSSPLAFDATITSLYLPLLRGDAVTLIPIGGELDQLSEILRTDPTLGLVKISPAHLHALGHMHRNESSNAKRHTFVIGGESLAPSTVELWRRLEPRSRLINEYGPTETVVGCSTYEIPAAMAPADSIPIGRPIANTQLYVLDATRDVAPIGIAGEICIAGNGVARGYLNRPRLTAERFVPNPFGVRSGDRMYVTGDVGRWRADGQLEFLGRNDNQVKIRGFRVELGEIEMQLRKLTAVREAVVVARGSETGGKRLVAYLVPNNQGPIDIEHLRHDLKAVLPDYMVPSAFVRLTVLPLTTNGKVDRNALPEPDDTAFALTPFEAPKGEHEIALAEIWERLLQIERVGRHDNFFELGGHSLLAIQLIERLGDLGLHCEVRTIFTHPTLAELAAVVTRDERTTLATPPNLIPPGCRAIAPEMLTLVELDDQQIESIVQAVPDGAENVQDIYPLTPLQEGILFHHLMSSAGDIYVTPMLFTADSRSQLDAALAALQAVIDRHEVLRTAIHWEELPRPVQVVHRRAELGREEIQLDPARDYLEQLKERMMPSALSMNLKRAPLLQVQIAASLEDSTCYALVLMHHIITDHVAQELILSEMAAHLAGRAATLPPPIPYREFVSEALRVPDASPENFFRSRLQDVTNTTAPFGIVDVHGNGNLIIEARQVFPSELTTLGRDAARELNISIASLLHAAWALTIARVADREDVVFGTVLSGRMHGKRGIGRVLGMFINTLPLRVRLQGMSARQLALQVHSELWELMNHEQTSLAAALKFSGIQGAAPLFNAIFNYRSSIGSARESAEIPGLHRLATQERTNFPISLTVDDHGDRLVAACQTDREIDPTQLALLFESAFRVLVDAVSRRDASVALHLDILPAQVRHKVIEEFNTTRAAYPANGLTHAPIEARARQSPDALAVIFEGKSLTYSQLNGKANQLAHFLRERGIGPDKLVAVCLDRSLEMVIALLGTLKAGGAYVPVDPTYPPERVEYMLTSAAANILLTQEHIVSRLPALRGEIIALDRDWKQIENLPTENPESDTIRLRPDHLAYVIFTSGSSGKPKGAMIEHRSLVNRLAWMQSEYHLTERDRVLQKTPFSFDVSVWEFFWTLQTGACLVVARPGGHLDPDYLRQLIDESAVTTAHFVPSMLQLFIAQTEQVQCRSLARVFCSGEALPADLAGLSLRRAPHVELHNLYGPTEATIDVTFWKCSGFEKTIPIGRPIWNTQMYILDKQFQPVPVGVVGEIYIAGVGVGRGYLNNPNLTQERFLKNPFSADSAARMYRTGDLGYWRTDGAIEFVGRNDQQVKIRGFRIELGEIESQLQLLPKIATAVVVAHESASREKRLIAYFTVAEGATVDENELRNHLKSALPEYMVPSAFIPLSSFALTPNGKLDRKALPNPIEPTPETSKLDPPQGEIERVLATMWRELLHLEHVGRHENFFELGGHSLILARLIARVRMTFKRELEFAKFFAQATLAAQAEYLESLPAREIARPNPIGIERRRAGVPLSPQQAGLWYLCQDAKLHEAYHTPLLLELHGSVDPQSTAAAIAALVHRHESLRSIVVDRDGQPFQAVLDESCQRPTVITVNSELAARAIVAEVLDHRFDWHSEPLFLAKVITFDSRCWVAINIHHIMSDAWSIQVLLRDFLACYRHIDDPRRPPPTPLRFQLGDYAAWINSEQQEVRRAEGLKFWRDQLTGYSGSVPLQTDRPRSSRQAYRGDAVNICWSQEVGVEIQTACARHSITQFMLLLSSYALLVSRLSNCDDVVIGALHAGRDVVETERLVGLLANMLPIRVRIDEQLNARDYLSYMRTLSLAALEHNDVPFERITDVVAARRSAGHMPLVQVAMTLQNTDDGADASDDVRFALLPASRRTSKFDLSLTLQQTSAGYRGEMEFDSDLFERETVAGLADYLRNIVLQFCRHDELNLADIQLVSDEETKAAVPNWNSH